MAQHPLSDELAQQAIDALRRTGGNQSAAAEALGLSRCTYVSRLRVAKARGMRAAGPNPPIDAQKAPPAAPVPEGFEVRSLATKVDENGGTESQWIGARPEGRYDETIPEGHLVKGYSTLIDEQGKIRAQWIKTGLDPDRFRAMVEASCRAAAEKIEPLPEIVPPEHTEQDLCTLYTITDAHIGMLAWAKETGAAWDLQIAERVLVGTLARMMEAAPASELGIVNQRGDFHHFDSFKPLTPEHGNLLDADSRYPKVVNVATRVIRRVIEKALTKHKFVRVVVNEGNHDPAGSVWQRELLTVLYENNPRVVVDDSPVPYVAYQHGETMLGFYHGHLARNESLPLLFAAKFPEMWGATKKRYIHTGHRHHVDEKEHPGVKVIQHSTIAAPDAHAVRGGWLSERQAVSMTYHLKNGEVSRGIFVPVE